MTATTQHASTATLEAALDIVIAQRFTGFGGATPPAIDDAYVMTRTGTKYADRSIWVRFIDNDPTCGIQVDVNTGNGVGITSVELQCQLTTADAPKIAALLVATVDLAA